MSHLWTLVFLVPSSNTTTTREIVFSRKKALEYQAEVCKKHLLKPPFKKIRKIQSCIVGNFNPFCHWRTAVFTYVCQTESPCCTLADLPCRLCCCYLVAHAQTTMDGATEQKRAVRLCFNTNHAADHAHDAHMYMQCGPNITAPWIQKLLVFPLHPSRCPIWIIVFPHISATSDKRSICVSTIQTDCTCAAKLSW